MANLYKLEQIHPPGRLQIPCVQMYPDWIQLLTGYWRLGECSCCAFWPPLTQHPCAAGVRPTVSRLSPRERGLQTSKPANYLGIICMNSWKRSAMTSPYLMPIAWAPCKLAILKNKIVGGSIKHGWNILGWNYHGNYFAVAYNLL